LSKWAIIFTNWHYEKGDANMAERGEELGEDIENAGFNILSG